MYMRNIAPFARGIRIQIYRSMYDSKLHDVYHMPEIKHIPEINQEASTIEPDKLKKLCNTEEKMNTGYDPTCPSNDRED